MTVSPSPSRRRLLQAVSLAGLLPALPAKAARATTALQVLDLRTAGQTRPMGVEDAKARLSWRLASSRRSMAQAAYRIEAATSLDQLRTGRADLWDSGRIVGDRTFDIAYGGKPLVSRQRVWWRVTVWDAQGAQAVSEPSSWEMGLLGSEDWTANWIAAETVRDRDDRLFGLPWLMGPETVGDQTSDFRVRFTLPQAADVDLVFSASADAKPFIDGRPLTAYAPLSWLPPSTTRSVRLEAGDHVLALRLGKAVARENYLKGRVGCAVMVRARYGDGAYERFDAKTARTVANASEDWTSLGFDDSAWAQPQRAGRAATAFASTGGAMLRRDFSLSGKVASARLYVTALGLHETVINGKPVDDALLAPEWTDGRKRILYRVIDVAALLRPGGNTIGAMVGDGWYGGRILATGRFSFGEAPLRYLAQLEITYADGRTETVATDDQWTVGASPVTYCDIYGGEDYDARREQPGWTMPGFKPPAGWTPVDVLPAAKGRLEAMITPPIRRCGELKPQSITKRPGGYIVDFGQNFAGWVKLKAKGRAGEAITLKFAERLTGDGDLDRSNLRTARASDTYILKGSPEGETYEPRFTYHGFRYVEISGLAAPPAKGEVTGVVVHSDLAETAHLRIGNPLIMQLWRNALWSQRSNFTGVPTDCPQRDERMAWLGDANVFWDAAAFNMDVSGFTRRWMGDIRASQTDEGVIPEISPTTWGVSGVRGSPPGWADAGVMLPWTVWRRYGDTTIIDQNWSLMTRYLDWVRKTNPDLLWKVRRGADYGDWLAFDAKEPGDPTTPKDLIGTAMWKRSVDAIVQMARASGRDDEAATYQQLADDLRAAFIKAYVQPDATVGNDSQTSYILALSFDLVPAELRDAALAKLKANVERRGHLTTGFLGTPLSLDALAETGDARLIYDLLLRTAYPSWGYMVAKGATTIWERWNSDIGDTSMNSFNHYALGGVNGFVYRRLAGIEPLEPGFRSFRVDPLTDPRVRTGGADYDAVVGRISTDWALEADGGLRLKVSAPANTHALVVLPTADASAVRESGRPLAALTSAKVAVEHGRITVKVGSGDYDFRVKPKA